MAMLLSTSDTDGTDLDATASLAVTLAWALAAAVVAYVVATVVAVVVRRVFNRTGFGRDLSLRMRRPTRVLFVVVAVWLAVRESAYAGEPWFPVLHHVMLIATIVTSTWLVGALAFFAESRALARVPEAASEDRRARRLKTQVTVIRRLTVAVLVVCAMAAILLTFPGARTAGASLFASAGVISVIAGLAAQTSLANVFAGMQIAFTEAIRVDDVVVLENEWGRIEEITLTYVVVHLWDDRRLILPCTYFTATPFQNWTRHQSRLLGTVELDLDFQVPLPAMRAELERLLARTDLWDERVGILQVTDATGGLVRARILVSAHDAPTLFDLRCFVREGLVEWLQSEAPQAMPRTRVAGGGGRGFLEEPVLPEPGEREDGGDAAIEGAEAAEGEEPGEVAEEELPAPIPPRRPVRLRAARPSKVPAASSPDDPTVMVTRPGPVVTPEPAAETVLLRPVGAEASAFFSGSSEAEERSKAFTGPQEVVHEEEAPEEEDANPRES